MNIDKKLCHNTGKPNFLIVLQMVLQNYVDFEITCPLQRSVSRSWSLFTSETAVSVYLHQTLVQIEYLRSPRPIQNNPSYPNWTDHPAAKCPLPHLSLPRNCGTPLPNLHLLLRCTSIHISQEQVLHFSNKIFTYDKSNKCIEKKLSSIAL